MLCQRPLVCYLFVVIIYISIVTNQGQPRKILQYILRACNAQWGGIHPYFSVINFWGASGSQFGPTHLPALHKKVTRISNFGPIDAWLPLWPHCAHKHWYICVKLSQRLIINIVKETFSALLEGETMLKCKYKTQGKCTINLTKNWTLVTSESKVQLHTLDSPEKKSLDRQSQTLLR